MRNDSGYHDYYIGSIIWHYEILWIQLTYSEPLLHIVDQVLQSSVLSHPHFPSQLAPFTDQYIRIASATCGTCGLSQFNIFPQQPEVAMNSQSLSNFCGSESRFGGCGRLQGTVENFLGRTWLYLLATRGSPGSLLPGWEVAGRANTRYAVFHVDVVHREAWHAWNYEIFPTAGSC